MSQVVSKIGFASVGDQRTGYGPCLQTIAAAGRRPALIKVQDDFGAVDEPLALWPDVLCVGRKTAWNSGPYDPNDAIAKILAAHQQKPVIHWWEYLNEIDGEWVQQADFYIGLLPLMKQNNLGLVLFNAAKGTPQYPEKDPVPYHEVMRACKFAKENGYEALLGLHEYGSGPDLIGRYKRLADYLEAYDALIPIILTEYGQETFPGNDPYMAQIKHDDQIYGPDARILGAGTWVLGGHGWSGSNYQTMLPQLGTYLATVPPFEPDADDDDRELDYWLDLDTGANLGNQNPTTITLTSDRNIRAITRPRIEPVVTHVLNLSTDGHGVVSGAGTYPHGATVPYEWRPV